MKKLTQDVVNELIDNAVENGVDMAKWSAKKITADLMLYSQEAEDAEEKDVIPMVDVWLKAKKKK